MSKEKEAYFRGLSQNERLTALQENADTKYSKTVVRNFSEDELTEMKNELSDVDINMNDAEIEKKEITKEVTGRINVFKSTRTTLLRNLKNKYFENDETVYDIADHDGGMMETYDHNGVMIGSRRLTPKEKQTKLITLNKVSNEG